MDPISISAGVVSFLEISRGLSKLLPKFIELKNAPDVLLALDTEIKDNNLLMMSNIFSSSQATSIKTSYQKASPSS